MGFYKLLRDIKPGHTAGLLFVLALHAAALYSLWNYHIIPVHDETVTLMVDLISAQPVPHEHAKPVKPATPPPSDPPPLLALAPAVVPDDPVVYVPAPQPQSASLPEAPAAPPAPPAPQQPVMLSGELSVACPERSPPEYPSFSRRLSEQGKVVLRVELGVDGRVESAEIKASSGYRRLDDAALNTVLTWRCKPSVRNGVAVRAVALQPFNFTLEGS